MSPLEALEELREKNLERERELEIVSGCGANRRILWRKGRPFLVILIDES